MIEFNTQIEQYNHWSLEIDGVIATLKLGVNEMQQFRPDTN